ncbi:MAG: ABC transporter substrate-binding protein [Oscillospiraceae bacterium]|nr:ABC transporter substrate-binding protein [Oscillospiraceae bacterium]
MKLKRILALVLSMVFTLFIVSACASDTPDGNTPDGGTPPPENGGGVGDGGGLEYGEDGEPPVFVPPNYVLPDKEADVIRFKDGKRHIIIAAAFDRFYDSTHTSIAANPNVADPETAQMVLDRVRYVEEKYDVFIEFVNMTWEGIGENIPISIMSGIPDADVYLVDTQMSIPAVLNGMAVALEDIGLEGHDVLQTGGNIVMESLRIPGHEKTYLFRDAGVNQIMYMMGYNKDMIDAHGLTDPQELWERGEWTWDTFREYCRVLTDPTQDIFGWSGYWTNFLTGLLFSNNAAFAAGPVQTVDSPETLEVLNFISDLYNVDRTARPWNADGGWEINNNLFAEGKSGFWISASWLNNEQAAGVTFEFGMVPFPVGPRGNKDTMATENAEGNFYFIPRYIQDPRFVFDVLYDLTNWFDYDLEYRDDLTWLKNSLVTEANFDMYMSIVGRPGFDLLHNLPLSPSVDMMLNSISGPPTYTPAQYVETFKQVFQDALDNYFG